MSLPHRVLLGGTLVLAALAAHCKKPDPAPGPGPKPAETSLVPADAPSLRPPGDAAHGRELVAQHECNRCHQGTENAAPPLAKDCIQCHVDIVAGRFPGKADSLARWKPLVAPLTLAPSLHATGARFRRSWIEGYLLKPHDLRPKLVQNMPRLGLSVQDARDIAAYLVPDEVVERGKVEGNLAKGRQVLESKGCAACHGMSGVAALASSPIPVPVDAKTMLAATALAPDLAHTRERFTPAKLAAWLAAPHRIKADTLMPDIPLSAEEIRDVTAYLYNAPLAEPAPPPAFVRLPVLERAVSFEEVDAKVFHKTCWHCHADGDFSIGDGGAGNTGGFGFAGRGLNLASYDGVAAGIKDRVSGQRMAVWTVKKELSGDAGQSLLVRSLVARHAEEAGADTGEVRGMPLGMPPLSAEQIQLVETWIAQGKKR